MDRFVVTRTLFGVELAKELQSSILEDGPYIGDSVPHWKQNQLLVYVTTDEASPRLDSIDGGAFSAGRPWLPVRLRPTVIHCGPIIWPGSTPCFRCSVNRMKQHSPVPSLVGSGPELAEGYAAFHVRLIAAAISLLEERFSEGEILGRGLSLIHI